MQVKSKCYFVLSKADLGISKCTDSYIVVQDGKTKNRDTIDAPGTFDYNLYSKDGRLLCIGKVTAVGAYGPQLDSVQFSKDTLPFTINFEKLYCQSIGLLGTNASPKSCYTFRYTADGKLVETDFIADTVPNLGLPFFSMGCHALTPCGITARIDDRIEYPDCKTSLQSGLFANIKRTWLARACINQPETPFATQYIPIRRPTKKDLQWSIPIFKTKELTVQYGDCTLDKSQIPLESIIPVVGKEQAKMNGQVLGLQYSYALSEKIDTVCNKTGLKLRRTYLIYDECKDQVIDTFVANFIPGASTKESIVANDAVVRVNLPKDVCSLKIPNRIDTIKKLLNLTINPNCPISFINWRVVVLSAPGQRPFSNPIEVKPDNDSLRIFAGKYKIYFAMLDSCQNLYTKTIDFSVKEPGTLNVTCPAPFGINLIPVGGVYERRNLSGKTDRQACGLIGGLRRIVSPDCVNNYLLTDYNSDRDLDILEHFELIKTGPFAGQYYTPWSDFLIAFSCDNNKRVYYESRLVSGSGKEGICSSYFDVGAPTNLSAKIEVDKVVAKPGRSTCVPIRVSGFNEMIAVQFNVKFDPAALSFDSIHLPPHGINVLHSKPGKTTDHIIFSWVYNGTKTASLNNQAILLEVCFSPKVLGSSKIWVDTTATLEWIDRTEGNYNIKTQVGEFQVLKPGDYQSPIREIQNSSPLDVQTDKQKIPDIKVFPNPSQDKVFISLPASWTPEGKIVLKDLQGRVLKRQEINTSLTTFGLGDQVPNGVHLLEVQSQNQVWTQSLVVLKP
ncbi:MAG: T9SS type A sorting domain-containing protein [Haliscomenobacter sp.]|uniref:T9SS type A sorting domain-containing protein n=1 Tax=Haliscomenobacter sp. TaxID=2717303 RepID=UPI0029ADC227|nr:T9SS type A sorting domain-containing protein [Haliscomenobacter sp.]MDX2068725.1 T9SS type A sorting domain-containing protein [Haliscomenobacter sp.]